MEFVLLLLLLVVALLPGLREWQRRKVVDLQRDAPGRFAGLSGGRTHYRWFGPESGPVIVCVHGLTTPSPVWDGLRQRLVEKGYRVLTYDLYGRGYSDVPRGPQTPGFFARQLSELLTHEGLQEDVTLMGYSMGGIVASTFTAEEDHRLRHLILIAPGGMGHDLGSLAKRVLDWPFIGDWLFHMVWPGQHRGYVEAERGLPTTVPDIADVQLAELDRRGFVPSVLSSLRGALRHPLEDAHRKIAQQGLPVLAIWGDADTVIPIRAMGRLTEWNRQARHEVIEGAGHALVYSHTDALVALLQPALARND
ncbi:MAG: alpha/beta hydrolase [Paracoccaceae bacterium]|nr:alpha/beta hydrolase [Paracoccaceae bacterium]